VAPPLRTGFALNFRTSSRDIDAVARVDEDVLDTIAYADRLGIDSVGVGQHHVVNTGGPFASPLPFRVAAAARTSRITLGTGVTTVPFEDPVLAEDAAFGLRPNHRHALCTEKVAALEGRPLSGGADGPPLYPPGTRVRGRWWQAATSLAGAAAAGAAGDGLQLDGFFDPAGTGQAPTVRAYLEVRHGLRPGEAPRVAVFRFVYPGRDKEPVLREVEPVLGPRLAAPAERAARSANPALRGLSVREYLDLVPFHGSPDDIAERVATDPAVAAEATDFVANFSYRDEVDVANAHAHPHTLATEIGWRPATAVR